MTPFVRPRRRLASAVLAVLIAVPAALLLTGAAQAAPSGASAAPAQPAQPEPPTGWVRLGHLSPKTPAVDIYLAEFGQPEQVAFRKAGYGNVTPYSTLAPGAYTVSMRPAGAPASSAPALTATVELEPGTAYTMLVFENGPNGTIRGELLTDDLSAPPPNSGKVRLVQGATGQAPVDVTTADGTTLASGLQYGQIADYVTLPAGQRQLTLSSGEKSVQATLDVKAGSTSTVVVLGSPDTGLTLSPLPDSTGVANAPTGGVETGAGGTATSATSATSAIPTAALGAAAALSLVAGLLTARVLRRRARV